MRRHLAIALFFATCSLAGTSHAQTLGLAGFTPSPTFALWDPAAHALKGDGSFARMSTGFEVSSSKRFGTAGGRTIGFEGGRMWQDGDWVYGIVGAVDLMQPIGSTLPAFGRIGYSRDVAGAVQFKAGRFVADNVLVYTKVGAVAVNETWRFGATRSSLPFSRNDIAYGPDARVGVEWAVTDNLSVALEAGVAATTVSR